MTININPQLVTNAAGTFNTTFEGLIQGTAFPDPAARFALSSGWLAAAETLPLWGGVGISEAVPAPQGSPPLTPNVSLGGPVRRATNVTGGGTALNLTGFSVFDQAYGMINSPQSPVPLAPAPYGQAMFYRLGSGARLAVAMSAALASLADDVITTQVSWDFVSQVLVPYVAAYPANALLAQSWASTNGGQVTFQTTTNHGLTVGSVFQISGSTPAGYNGQYTAIAGTATDTIVAVKTVDPGASSVLGTLVAGGGALPCRVLRVQTENCMTVVYDPTTGFATWNRNGAAAVILI